MKYGIWRHENALGNSAEQAVALSRFIKNNKDTNPVVYVEKEFQKYYAMCIPGVLPENVKYFDNLPELDIGSSTWKGYDNKNLKDILMPAPPYKFTKGYPGTWYELCKTKPEEPDLIFPFEIYDNKHNLPQNTIVISIREQGTFYKRISGANEEPHRFVNPDTFFKVALHYANKNYTVIRIGDANQTPMPKHENIIDFALVSDRNMLDDLYLLSTCKVHLSSDSGVWPMTGGFKSNLVFSNFCNGTQATVDWLDKGTTTILPKINNIDNTFEQLVSAVDIYL